MIISEVILYCRSSFVAYADAVSLLTYVVKVHCNLRFVDEIEEIDHNLFIYLGFDHNDANINWSSDEDSDGRSLTFERNELYNFLNFKKKNFFNFIINSSNFTNVICNYDFKA